MKRTFRILSATVLLAFIVFGGAVHAQTPEFTISGSQDEITGLYSLYAPSLLDANTMLIGGWKSSADRTNFAAWRNPFRTWLSPIVGAGESVDLTKDWPWDTSRSSYISQEGNPPAAVVGPDKVFRTTKSGTWSNNPSLVFERVGDHVNDGDVVQVGSKTYMFYTSLSNEAVAISVSLSNFQHSFTKHEVGVAESTNNGASWTDRGIVIARADSGDGQGAWAPSALVVGSEIWVYYHTGTTSFTSPIVFRQKFNKNSLAKIGSPERLAFSDDSGLLANVDIEKVGSKYILTGNLLGRSTLDTLSIYYSDDGMTFLKLPDADDGTNILVQRSSGVAVTPEIVPSGANAKIYYGQGSGAADGFNVIRSLDITIANAVQEAAPGNCTVRSLGSLEKNVTGYAWSSTIGWLSTNCENEGTCGTSDYGLAVDSNGDIDGYAWSPNVGWVSFFGGDTAGCPSGSCQASLNRDTGEVTGWARALAPVCGGYAPQSGGWDGWVHLGQSSRVGVDVNSCSWEGYAWGGGEDINSGIIGWLSFKGPGYGVTGSGNACAVTLGEADLTAGTVTATGENDDAQMRFDVPISNIGGENIVGGIDMRVQIALHSDSSSTFDLNFDVDSAVVDLNGGAFKNGTYTWDNPVSGRHQVRVCADLPNNEIAEANEGNNCGPATTFQVDNGGNGGGLTISCVASPGSISAGESVTWSSSVSGNVGVTTYSWAGDDGLSGSGPQVTKTYSSTGTYEGRLTVAAENASETVVCGAGVGNGGGGGGCTSNCGVVVGSSPTATLTASPNKILVGESASLSWSSTGAGSCTGTGFSTGGAASGSVTVSPTNDAIYQVSCGSAIANETVEVLQPNITIEVNGESGATRVSSGEVVTVVWHAEDIDSCDIVGPGILVNNATDDPLDGSADATITARSVYTIECDASGETFTESVTVNIPPDFEEF